MSELSIAEYESAMNEAVDAYFEARPQIFRTREKELYIENGFRIGSKFMPIIEIDNETLKKAAANMVIGIPESDEEFRFRKAEIISEVIDAVACMLGWRKT